jgi:hypothetical protein
LQQKINIAMHGKGYCSEQANFAKRLFYGKIYCIVMAIAAKRLLQ